MKSRLTVVPAWLAAAAAAAAFVSCSPAEQDSASTTSSPTASADTPGNAGIAAASPNDPSEGSGGAGAHERPPPEPCPDWPGWETWDDFAPDCPFCVPASRDALPEPIEWEPCPAEASLPAGSCQRMKPTWPWPLDGHPFTFRASVDASVPGKIYLQFKRASLVSPNPWRILVVAEADGPVHFAFLDPRKHPVGCAWGTASSAGAVRHGKIIGFIQGDRPNVDLQKKFPEAIWGVTLGELRPKVLASWSETTGHVPVTSDLYWGSWNGVKIEMATWGGPLETVFHGSQAGGLQQNRLEIWHDFALWRSSTLVYAGAMAWKAGLGAYPFITFPGDASRGVHGMGTDGEHLVWTYGEGKQPGEHVYPIRSVMTAPFTTNPAELQPRRLRSYPVSDAVIVPWAVGCGYGAHNLDYENVLVVRLSDGVSWMLTAPCGVGNWCWGTVYAVTCEEIFLRGTMGKMNIARVKLDSLGPALTPD